MNAINVLIKEAPESSRLSLLLCENTVRRRPPTDQEESPHALQAVDSRVLDVEKTGKVYGWGLHAHEEAHPHSNRQSLSPLTNTSRRTAPLQAVWGGWNVPPFRCHHHSANSKYGTWSALSERDATPDDNAQGKGVVQSGRRCGFGLVS